MSKPRRAKAIEAETKLVEYPVVTFDGRDFEIHPMSDRDDEQVYQDNARFLAIAVPLGTKVYSEIMEAAQNNPAIINRVAKAQQNQEDDVNVIMDLFAILSKLDTGALIEELAEVMPKLAAIACHYTDPDVSVKDIQCWSKGPLNYMLWKATIKQLKAEGIMGQFNQLQDLLSEFKAA